MTTSLSFALHKIDQSINFVLTKWSRYGTDYNNGRDGAGWLNRTCFSDGIGYCPPKAYPHMLNFPFWAKLRRGCKNTEKFTTDESCRPYGEINGRSIDDQTYVDYYNNPCSTPCAKVDGLGYGKENYFWCWYVLTLLTYMYMYCIYVYVYMYIYWNQPLFLIKCSPKGYKVLSVGNKKWLL